METRDNGLGMYSSVSENPTLFRAAGLGDCSSCTAGAGGLLGSADKGSVAEEGVAFSVSAEAPKTGKAWPTGRSATAGLDGALFPLTLGLEGGTMIEDRSWLEIAADRR